VIYSIDDAVKLAEANPKKEVVFMAVGFETTAPSTAVTLLNNPPSNFSILNCHRYVPPALKAVIEMGEIRVHGLIEPGHVSTILGTKTYEFLSRDYHVPQVIAGFEPLDLLMGVYLLARQIKEGRAEVENEYGRLVRPEGNPKALKILDEVFDHGDVEWRGFPVIKDSAMLLKKKFERYDARKKFESDLNEVHSRKFECPKGCKCGEVLRGLLDPKDCALFGTVCTPRTPIGPCMVTFEGGCNIEYRYGAKKN
jgi:hydrogenase expression/formation protein HypD